MSETPMIRRDNGAATVTIGPDLAAYEELRDCPECGRTYKPFVNIRCPECEHRPGATNGGKDE